MLIHKMLEEARFSPSEQTIVNYLLNHPHQIDHMTTTQIAEATFTSKSLIVRIAKKLGFSGWKGLREALLSEYESIQSSNQIDANLPFLEKDNIKIITTNIAKIKIEAINETAELNHYTALQKATRLIHQGHFCHVFAVGNNVLIAKEFEYNLRRLKKLSTVYSIQGEGLFGAVQAKSNECAILISYSGETEYIIRCLHLLKERSVPTIAITNIGDTTLSKHADIVLRLSTREKLFSKIATFANDASLSYILDLLYAGVFSFDYQANLKQRHDDSLLVEKSRIENSKLLK